MIADPAVWSPDPIALRSAGQEYLLGFADTPRAFHPKLMLLQGGDGVLAAIGSGNLTTSGWQFNTELWRCLEGTASGAPTQPLLELAEWLDQLTTTATMAGPHRDAIRRSTDRLLTLMTRVPEQPSPVRVLPLDRPIIDGLPRGPVDELILAAPFIDPAAEAIDTLLQRLQPRQTTIVLQEDRGRFDPATHIPVLNAAPGTVTVIADRSRRYRHAKLIEWRTGTQRWALTGSANLTGSALLRRPGRGDNIELDVLEELTDPEWPPPTGPHTDDHAIVAIADLPTPAPAPGPTATVTGLPLLLSAVWQGRDLDLELSAPCPPMVEVQARNHPIDGTWRGLGTIPVDAVRHHLPGLGVDDVAHVRLAVSGSAEPVAGQPVPVTNLARATRPPLLGGGQHRRISTADDLLGDDLGYLTAFGDQLTALAEERRRISAATTPQTATTTARVDHHDDNPAEALWRWETAARSLHGPALIGFALGLPPAAPGDAWEDFDNPGGELASDTAITSTLSETITDDTDNEPVDHSHHQPVLQRTRRRWVHGYADLAHRENRDRLRAASEPAIRSQLSTLSWLAVTRLSLVFYCAGNWPEDDETPAQHLAELLTTLLAGASAADHLDEAAALAAVTVAAVRQRAGSGATGAVTVATRRVEAAAQPVLVHHHSPPTLLTEYCRCLRTPAGLPVDPELVDGQLDAWLHQPLQQAVQRAQARGWDCVEATPQVLQVTGTISDPITAATSLLAGTTGPAAVDARSATRPLRGIVIWAPPDLYTIRLQTPPLWEHYTHTDLGAILTSWNTGDRRRYRQHHGPTRQPIPEAAAWLNALGIDPP